MVSDTLKKLSADGVKKTVPKHFNHIWHCADIVCNDC